jgi:hypothetical protein
MDCRSCGVVNAPGRRYCRECGGRLGQPCPVCHFFNAVEDKHCGGCGRRLKAAADAQDGELPALSAHVPGPVDDRDFGAAEPSVGPAAADKADQAGIAGQSVSQSEIDGLFENILDDEPEESTEGGA